MAEGKLTNKQEMFCAEYLIDLNATQAAIRAGYSEKTAKDIGCENLAKPNIQAKLAVLMKERSEKTKIDAAWVLTQAAKVHQMCMQAEPVFVGGEPTGEYKFDSSGANKSLEIIGKHVDVQAFLTKQEVKAEIKEVKSFSEMYGNSNGNS